MKKKDKKYPRFFVPLSSDWAIIKFVRINHRGATVIAALEDGDYENKEYWSEFDMDFAVEKGVWAKIPEEEVALLL